MASNTIVTRVSTTQQFNPSATFSDRAKANLITLWTPARTSGAYRFKIATGEGGFTDAVNTAALLTTATVETRQRQDTLVTEAGWNEYSDLLSAVFQRLRQAAENVVEENVDAEMPVQNDIFLQMLQHNPHRVEGTNDALAKECIKHFLDAELLRTSGRLVIDHSKWSKPLQWANTVRLAQSGINVDPDNIPSWETQLHHSNLQEHFDELGTVLNLTETALFCPDLHIPCSESSAEADSVNENPADITHYLPTSRETGANAAAWLWNMLVTEGGSSAAIDRLERAHTSTLPFGSIKDPAMNFASAVFTKLKQQTPLLAIAEPMMALSEHTTTVSFGANYVSGTTNTLSTWGVGVASTAIEEALQLAVATLYAMNWKPNNTVTPQTRRLGQVRALLQAPLLQGLAVHIENANMPRVPFEHQLDMRQRPHRNDDMLKQIFAKLSVGIDAVRAQEGKLVIEVHFDYMFYGRATGSWDPDVGYRTSYETPREVFLSASASADEAMTNILDTLRAGFEETVTNRKSVKVVHGERSVNRNWIGELTIENTDDVGARAMLEDNVMRLLDRVWQRQHEIYPSTVVWQDPSLAAYPDQPSTWNSSTFDAPPGRELYVGRTTAQDHAVSLALEKAIINYVINPDSPNPMVHLTAVSDEQEFVCRMDNVFLRMIKKDVSSVTLTICNTDRTAAWNVTLKDVTRSALQNTRGKLVMFDRSAELTYHEWEENKQQQQLLGRIGREATVEQNTSIDEQRAQITLLEIKEEYRKNLQVYYTKVSDARRYTYCGAVSPDNKGIGNELVAVIWEDGYHGKVKPSELLVMGPNIRHRNAKLLHRLEYEYNNELHTANLLVSMDHLIRYDRPEGYSVVLVGISKGKEVLRQATVKPNDVGDMQLYSGVTEEAKVWSELGPLDNILKQIYVRYNPRTSGPVEVGASMAVSEGEARAMKFSLYDIAPAKRINLALKPPFLSAWTAVESVDSEGMVSFVGTTKQLHLKNTVIEPVMFRPAGRADVAIAVSLQVGKDEVLAKWPTTAIDGHVLGTDYNAAMLLKFIETLLSEHKLVADTFILKVGTTDIGPIDRFAMEKIPVQSRLEVHASASTHRYAVVDCFGKKVYVDMLRDKTETFNDIVANDECDDPSLKSKPGPIDVNLMASTAAVFAKGKSFQAALIEAYNSAKDACDNWPSIGEFVRNIFIVDQNEADTTITQEMKEWPKNLDGSFCDVKTFPTWKIKVVFGHHKPVDIPVYGKKVWGMALKSAKAYYEKWLMSEDEAIFDTNLVDIVDSVTHGSAWVLTETDENGVESRNWLDKLKGGKVCIDPKHYTLDCALGLKNVRVAQNKRMGGSPTSVVWKELGIFLVINQKNRFGDWHDRWKGHASPNIFSDNKFIAFSADTAVRFQTDSKACVQATTRESGRLKLALGANRPKYIDLSNLPEQDPQRIIDKLDGKALNLISLDLTNTPIAFDTEDNAKYFITEVFLSRPKLRHIAWTMISMKNDDKFNYVLEPKGKAMVSMKTLIECVKQDKDNVKNTFDAGELTANDNRNISSLTDCLSKFAHSETAEKIDKRANDDETLNLYWAPYTRSNGNFFNLVSEEYKSTDIPQPSIHSTPLPTYREIVDENGDFLDDASTFLHSNFLYLTVSPGSENWNKLPPLKVLTEEAPSKRAKIEEEVKVPTSKEGWRQMVEGAYPRMEKQGNPELVDAPLYEGEDDGQAYTRWRHTMEDNMMYASYFRDPLPGQTKLVVKVVPEAYTVRANNLRTRKRLSNALMEGKILHVPDFHQEHIASADNRYCWEVNHHRISAVPEGSNNAKAFTVTCEKEAIHNAVADAFGGWHYARSTEPRQTAHANLMGPLVKQALAQLSLRDWFALHKSVKKEDLPENVRSREMPAKNIFSVFAAIQAATPTLVEDLQIMVKGPGRDSVATACKVPAVKRMTALGYMVESEINHQLVAVAMTLPKRISPNCIGATVKMTRKADCRTYFDYSEAHAALARAFTETALADSVRAGAGKRYHHNLPVRAGQIALRSALHDLLMVEIRS